MQVYYDRDADLSVLRGKKIAVLGYGSQGHAHANNLRDSGVEVVVGLRRGSSSWPKAENAGLKVLETAEADAAANIVMILLPTNYKAKHTKRKLNRDSRKAIMSRLGTVLTFTSEGSCHRPMSTSSWLLLKVPDTWCAVNIKKAGASPVCWQYNRTRPGIQNRLAWLTRARLAVPEPR